MPLASLTWRAVFFRRLGNVPQQRSTGSAVKDLSSSPAVSACQGVDFGGGLIDVSTLGTGRLVVSGGSLYVVPGILQMDGSSAVDQPLGHGGALTNWSSSLPLTLTMTRATSRSRR